MALSSRATALQRAAAADATGTLGDALRVAQEETIRPSIAALLEAAVGKGRLTGSIAQMTDVFLALLLADWPLRVCCRSGDAPDLELIEDRAKDARETLEALFGAN